MSTNLPESIHLYRPAARAGITCSPGYLQERSSVRMVPSGVQAQQTTRMLSLCTSMPTQQRQELPR